MKFAVLLLALCFMLMPLRAQENNLLANADFEAPDLAVWPSIYSRDAGAVQAVRDTTEKHGGAASLKVTHTGDKDWAVSQNKRLPTAPGDILALEGWIKAKDLGSAQMSVVTRDDKGAVLSWSFGEIGTHGTHDWQLFGRKFVAPQGCASIEFRVVGFGPGTVWLDDLALRRAGNTRDFTAQTAPLPPLENQWLRVEIDGRGLLRVTDKRTGQTWRQDFADEALLVKSAAAQGKNAARLELWDLSNDLTLSVTLQLEAGAPELTVTLNGKGAQRQPIAYPSPFVTEKGTALVVPLNEGILYPVDDAGVRPMQLVAYGGHGICMAWWGAFDEKSGAGAMTILNTPDDAHLDIARKTNLFARPLWQPQKAQFGYARKLTYVFFDKGGYVAQAKRYRRHAQQIGLFKTLAQKRDENPNVDLLLGAANIWNWDMDKVALCREMKDLGFERVLWSGGGRAEELKQINDLGYLTGRYDIYSDVWAPGGPKHLRTEGWPEDLVWLQNGDWMRGWAHHQKNPDGTMTVIPGGVICSSVWVKRAKERIPPELKVHPYRARFIDTVTASPWRECWNPAHPLTRTQDKVNKMATLDYVQNELKLVTGAETGVDASVPFVCYYEGMLSLGPYRLPDSGRDMLLYKAPTPDFLKFQVGHFYRVPLWEVVYHDCVVAQWYWGDYNNKAPEVWAHRDLFNILYGTPPMYMFNRATWEKDKARFAESYKAIGPVARRLGTDEMLSHEFLTPDHAVQRTKWKSGAAVTVNFGDAPFKTPDGREVKAMGWLVEK